MLKIMRFLLTILLLFTFSVLSSSHAQVLVQYSESAEYEPRVLKQGKKTQKSETSDSNKKGVNGDAAARSFESPVTIPVSVFNGNGNLMVGLSQKDFSVFVSGVEVEVLSVQTRDEPITLVIVLDMSPSTNDHIKAMKAIAYRLVDRLRPTDKVMVAGFFHALQIAQEPTQDRRLIAKAIDRLEMGDGTSVYNAVHDLFEKRISNIPGIVAMTIITDGIDTTSKKASYETSLAKVEESNATVFPIYFNTFVDPKKQQAALSRQYGFPFPIPGKLGSKEEADAGREYLNDLIRLSGGRTVLTADILAGKVGTLDSIPAELRSRSYITFKLPAEVDAGRAKLRIRVSRPNLTVLAKGSLMLK